MQMSQHILPSPSAEGVRGGQQQGSGKRRKVSTACSACKQRKTKCSGATPCDACALRGSECLYDITADQRRKIASHRHIQDLSEARSSLDRHQQLLGGMVATIRAGSREAVDDFLTTVQSGVDLSQIAAHVRNALRADQAIQSAYTDIVFQIDGHPELPSPTQLLRPRLSFGASGSDEDSPQQVQEQLSLDKIIDLRNAPIKVPAYPWTSITISDDLVSHLVSLWFTWIHPWWHWVDKDVFLEAMAGQDINSPFCTPYLVNMILADACLLHDTNNGHDAQDNLRRRFLNEAVTSLERQPRPASLAYLQALGIQYSHLNIVGEDKLGLRIFSEQISRAGEVEQWRIQQGSVYSFETLQKIDRSLDLLAWMLYITGGISVMNYKQIEPPNRPSRSMPLHDCRQHSASKKPEDNIWISYPSQRGYQSLHLTCHFTCLLNLAEMIYDGESILKLTKEGSQFDANRFEDIFHKFRDWPSQLPECMQLIEGSNPQVITLHVFYRGAIINIYQQAIAAEEGHVDHPLLMHRSQSTRNSVWKPLCQKSAIAIGHLMSQHQRNWGVERFPPVVIQAMSLAIFTLLDDLEPAENQSLFVSLCYNMQAASKRYRAGKGVLSLIRQTAMKRGIQLPSGADRYLMDEATDREPSQSAGATAGIDIDSLLGKWKDFDLNK